MDRESHFRALRRVPGRVRKEVWLGPHMGKVVQKQNMVMQSKGLLQIFISGWILKVRKKTNFLTVMIIELLRFLKFT